MALDDLKERSKAIDIAVGQIEKQFGKGSIMRLGQRNAITPIESISSGSISIDYALGIGGRTRVKVVKNKVAPPFREAEFDIMYGEGISREGDLLDLAVEKRIVEKSGAWFAYAGERLGQGRENAKQFLRENVEVRRAIDERVRKELGLVREPEVVGV